MAETKDEVTSSDGEKPNPLPLIIGIVVIIGLIYWFMSRKKTPKLPPRQGPLPQVDPCKGIPEWACATAALLNPLAKTSVDVFKAQAQADIQRAQIEASQRRY